MGRKIVAAIIWGILIVSIAAATTVPGGYVSGTWPASGSPYLIEGEITIHSDSTLVIEPGVDVIFQGHYKFIVNGFLEAVGTETDSILFTAADTSEGWHGIRFVEAPDSSRLEYCHITHGFASSSSGADATGGGIYCIYSNPIIKNCLIDNCSANSAGGGIHCSIDSNPIISYNKINGNAVLIATAYGGGICCENNSCAIISSNIIIANSCSRGGGISCLSQSHPTIESNLIAGNSANSWGGGINCQESNPSLINNTIVNNSAQQGGGIHCYSGSVPEVSNCIIWGNSIYGSPIITFSDVQGGWPGTGNINEDPLFASNPLYGDYFLSQFVAGQSQQSPSVDAGDPTSPLIDGTTRTDGVPDAGIVDMGYHYPAFSPPPPPPPQTVTLTPYNPPIVIPAPGGSFDYNIEAANLESLMVNCDIWIDVTLPDSSIFGPVVGPRNQNIPAGMTISRDRSQSVPANAPAGTYSYNAYIGVYPDSITDSDSFPFEKLETGEGQRVEGWANWGELFNCRGDSRIAPTDAPEVYLLGQAYPNPFNPITTLSFELPVACWVKLEVFDISGRLVGAQHAVPLLDEWLESGNHEVTFDASDLASGIYIARLEAGDFTTTRKMVLVK